MNLVIYDPEPFMHDYISAKFFRPMLSYRRDVRRVESLDGICNSVVLAFCGYFTPDVIDRLKNDGNKLISFDINDSTWLSEAYRFKKDQNGVDYVHHLDLIFKFSGIPKVQYSDELRISDNIEYSKERKYYLDDDEWAVYCKLKDDKKIVPMPHIPWPHFHITPVAFEKKAKVLIRGGNHYLRYHLFLNLLKRHMVGSWSGFFLRDYHKPEMKDEFRYCDDCVRAFAQYGKIPYSYYKENDHRNCNNPFISISGDIVPGTFQNEDNHRWNNKCAPMYYWLTDKFMEAHGPVDMGLVEAALNQFYMHSSDMGKVLAIHLYTADYKWIYSIDIPPRFWEGCAAKTINLLPRWTSNQEHFPNLIDGEHYISYDESFEGAEDVMSISKERYEHITESCKKIYNEWISDPDLGISTKLMDRVFDHIEGAV